MSTDLDAETRALLQLSLIPGVGPNLVGRLIDRFWSAVKVAAAWPSELAQVEGIGDQLVARLAAAGHRQKAEQEWRCCQRHGVWLVGRGGDGYPRNLNEIYDPPTVLYGRGTWQSADALAVAIVGTRQATHYGLRQASRLAASLSRAGVTIVSGLARGVDAAAHRAALQASGRTVAVLAGGMQQLYPPDHETLADEIARQGAVISELPLQRKPRRGSFPRRNRLISGLSLGVVVVEAALRSGAMITARHALDQGREVFAMPGPIDSPHSRGCHQLLRDGAKLVESENDILEELGPLTAPVDRGEHGEVRDPIELQLNPQEHLVLQAIDSQATRVDQIVLRSGLPVQRILATLSVLEMRRLIRRISGDSVARC